MTTKKPARWTGSDEALKAVQVAFDVEQDVLNAVRRAAFENDLSTWTKSASCFSCQRQANPNAPG
ncbi:MAG: hypothetical protein R3E56_14565 [Burkholderiaceae bacterium]